jgi:hypothetical protein
MAMISKMRGRVTAVQALFREGQEINGEWTDIFIRFECDLGFRIITVKTRPVRRDDFDNVVQGAEFVRARP